MISNDNQSSGRFFSIDKSSGNILLAEGLSVGGASKNCTNIKCWGGNYWRCKWINKCSKCNKWYNISLNTNIKYRWSNKNNWNIKYKWKSTNK